MLGQHCRRWPTSAQHSFNVSCLQGRRCLKGPQQRQDIDHVLVQCWPSVSDVGPALKQNWSIYVYWYDVSILEGSAISGTQISYVIGPMISLRSRLAYPRMFFTTIGAVPWLAYKPRVRFSKAIYIIAKYCIDIMIDLVSRVKHLLAFPSFKLLLWCFLKIILA